MNSIYLFDFLTKIREANGIKNVVQLRFHKLIFKFCIAHQIDRFKICTTFLSELTKMNLLNKF